MCDADFQYHGMGLEIFRTGENEELSFRDTNQFSLAVMPLIFSINTLHSYKCYIPSYIIVKIEITGHPNIQQS
jgi:hypothetical protein